MKEWVKLEIPLAAGLSSKGDARASQPPEFDLLRDVEFEEVGGLQTRKPFTALGANIFGGGTLSDVRRLYQNGPELLCFTKTGLYSWNATLLAWVLKGTHLAVKTAEETKFATTDDQVDCDRAELNGTVFYCWSGGVPGFGFVAAQDKVTGSVIMAPTALAGGGQRMRLTALTTKVLLTFYDGVAGTYVYALDPASPASGIAGASTTASPTGGGQYDIVKIPGADTAAFVNRLAPTTSYRVGTITAGLVVTSSTKARTCTAGIALSVNPAGTHVQVARVNGLNVVGDYIALAGLADVYTAQVVGVSATTPDHVTCAHRSIADGAQFRCYVFWSDGELMSSNWADTGGVLGTAVAFVTYLNLASRAFDHEGRVYLWTSFTLESTFFGAGSVGGYGPRFSYALQNTYFLYRDDAFLVAKAAGAEAGDVASSVLPGVQSLGSGVFAWCGVERGIIDIGGAGERRTKYAARSPLEISFTFDSNEARRTARLGQTLYITGGEILQYDGTQITEVGFHIYPHFLGFGTAVGAMIDGTYAYKQTWRWDNARGEVDRSTTATTGVVATTAGPKGVTIAWTPLSTTHKTNRPIAVETWRTAINPPPEAPFYLVTSKDPAIIVAPNQYLPNDSIAAAGALFTDALVDTSITNNETSAENGGYLEPLAPPPATIIAATADRIFLAGVAGDPHRVWYSRQRQDGEVASFHDVLTINIPPEGGDITAIAFLNETLVVFRESAVYILPGTGFDNLSSGQNYGPATKVSTDVGAVSMESVALTDGGLIFKSSKGFYMLSARFACEYIGYPVADFDGDTIIAAHTLESQHQVRFVTNARIIVFDYRVSQWVEWTVAGAVHAALWDGRYLYLAAAPMVQSTTYTGVAYGMDVETAWIKLNELQGAGSVRWLSILGEYRGAHHLRVRIARDYLQDGSGAWNWYQDEIWAPSPTVIGGPEQVRIGPSVPRCQAIKIRITAIRRVLEGAEYITYAPITEALKLTGLALEVGIDKGINRRLPVAQKE